MARYIPPAPITTYEFRVTLQTGNNVWTNTFYANTTSTADIAELIDAIIALLKALYRIIVIIRKVTVRSGIYNNTQKTFIGDGAFQDTTYIQEPANQADVASPIPYRNMLNVHFDSFTGHVNTMQFPIKIGETEIENGVLSDAATAFYQAMFDTFYGSVGTMLTNIRGATIEEISVDKIPGSNRRKRY